MNFWQNCWAQYFSYNHHEDSLHLSQRSRPTKNDPPAEKKTINQRISCPSSRFRSCSVIVIHFHINSLFHFHFHFHIFILNFNARPEWTQIKQTNDRPQQISYRRMFPEPSGPLRERTHEQLRLIAVRAVVVQLLEALGRFLYRHGILTCAPNRARQLDWSVFPSTSLWLKIHIYDHLWMFLWLFSRNLVITCIISHMPITIHWS